MPSLARRLAPLALALQLTACASTVDGGPTDASPADAPPTDAASTADAGAPTDANPPTCSPRGMLTVPADCADLRELAVTGNAVAGSPDTFALEGLQPTRNQGRAACVVEPWQDRFDARVRFTPPRGGRWRITATGGELWSLDVQRACGASMTCVGQPDLHGPFASATLTTDVQLERGESTALLLDGCPDGSCRYTLRAQRIGDLACEFSDPAARRCTAPGQSCAIDPCDAERFRCDTTPTAAARFAGVRVLVDRARGTTWVAGRLASVAASWATLFVRWVDAAGATVGGPDGGYLGSLTAAPGDFVTGRRMLPPAGATRGVFWLYDDAPIENHPGFEAPIEDWSPVAAGGRCDASVFATRCGPGLRCGASSLCEAPRAVELTRVSAWRDDAADLLRVAIEGTGVGAHVQEFDVTLLDASGATLARVPTVVTVTTFEVPSDISFRASFVLSNDPARWRAPGVPLDFVLPRGVASVRLVARDAMGNRSAPLTARVTPVRTVALGAFCDDPGVGCAAGQTCRAPSDLTRERCEPSPPAVVCGLLPGLPTWAPPRGGATYTVDGVAHQTGGVTRCYGGRGPARVQLEFVAPVAGAYRFEQRGMRALEVLRACDGADASSACMAAPMGSTTAAVTVTLTAGQRVPVTLVGDTSSPPRPSYALSVEVP